MHDPAAVPESAGLRERKKAETRFALANAALSLALRRDVEALTADEIAASANVSPRTFHNYFGNKEEAVVAGWRAILRGYVDELLARPADETPLTALERVLAPIAAAAATRTDETEAHLDLLASPTLARYRGLLIEEAVRAFADAIATRTGTDPVRDVYPRLVTTTAISAIVIAYDEAPPGTGAARLETCFALLRDGLRSPARTPAPGRAAGPTPEPR